MKLGQEKEFKMNSGKAATLIVLNLDPLVIGWKSEFAPKGSWNYQKATIEKWYEYEFPDELKSMFKLEDLHPLTVENLVIELPKFAIPIKAPYSFKLEYFPDVSWNDKCKERQYYDWYWLENGSSGSSRGSGGVGSSGSIISCNWNTDCVVFPAFHINL